MKKAVAVKSVHHLWIRKDCRVIRRRYIPLGPGRFVIEIVVEEVEEREEPYRALPTRLEEVAA